MTTDETPTPGPELDSVYQPGNPGAPWTKGEVVLMMMVNHDDADDNDGADDDADDNDGADNDADDNDGADDDDDDDDDDDNQVAATRMRVLQMIHPDWNVKKKQVRLFPREKALSQISRILFLAVD